MPTPLVRDDEPDVPEEPPQRDPLNFQPVVQKGENIWSIIRGFGDWLSRQRLPPGANKYLKDEARKMWTGEKGPQRRKPQKWTSKPFTSFGVKDRKKRKDRL
jgi:hypothetical protein